jgi:hypothetical protein
MTDTRKPNREGRAGGRSFSGWRVGLIFGLLLIVVFVGCREFVFRVLAEPPEDTLTIENRTEETLLIYLRRPAGTEVPLEEFVPEIPPGASVQTDLACTSGRLVARSVEGELVATRGPFDECNLDDWIVDLPQG